MQQYHQQKDTSQTSSAIKVFIRVRPLVPAEKQTSEIVEIQPDNKTLKIYNDQINHIQSKFDTVIGTKSSQQQVFSHFQSYVKRLFQGYNLTIFAYGQTGSGKTFTMFGSDWQVFVDNMIASKSQSSYFSQLDTRMSSAGIIPRSINAVFKEFEQYMGRFQLFCSFLQIYNQKIYDLLQDSPTPKALNIHESKVNGIFVEGLTQFQVQQFGDCLKLMRQGQKNRFIRQTSMNAKSSRSHTIFQILIEATTSDSNGNYIKARLNLCDLAGSQKIHKGQNLQNEHLQQLKNINLSLTTLGKVINSLSSGKKATVAAFRESKLTRLLQQSLTVNTNTFIIGNISPSSRNLDETINTLKFAQRASHITMKIKPIQFSEMNPDAVTKLKKQIEYLKGLLDQKKNGENPTQFQQNQKQQESQQKLLSPKQFQKLLKQNRQIKREIYQLQYNLQILKSQNSQMNHTARQSSAGSSSARNDFDISTHNSLRREMYLEKFMKKVPEDSKKQSKNNSLLVSAGKATIDHQETNQKKQKKIQQNRQQKLTILKKFQKLQSAKKQNEQVIMQELQSLKNISSGKKGLFRQNSKKNENPRRYHEANVLRRGKMSVDVGILDSLHSKLVDDGDNFMKKKKVDYSDKIRQLEQRLYNK